MGWQVLQKLYDTPCHCLTCTVSSTKLLKPSPTVSPLKTFRPTTPGPRHRVALDTSLLWKGEPLKKLTKGLMKTGGRNNMGRITARHRGGGHKRLYRIIDFARRSKTGPGVVKRIEYDPNRSCRIALLEHEKAAPGEKFSYILAPRDITLGQTLHASRSQKLEVKPGNAMTLKNIPLGTIVHNIELLPGKGGQLCRAAGTSCSLLSRHPSRPYLLLKLSSGEQRYVHQNCMATVGALSNPLHKNRVIGKAGRNRWLGKRPRVRGVAMNPCDHPHGGGEGRSKGGRPSSSPWGWTCKGRKTRIGKAKDDWRILIRRPKRKSRK